MTHPSQVGELIYSSSLVTSAKRIAVPGRMGSRLRRWPTVIRTRYTGQPGQVSTSLLVGRQLLLPILAIALAGAAAAGLSACGSSTTREDIDRLIQDSLSPGSTAEEIFAFLDSRDIDHGPIERAGPASTLLADAGVPPSTKIIGAIVRDTSKGSFTRTDILIFFLLDDEERLKDYLIREVFTSL